MAVLRSYRDSPFLLCLERERGTQQWYQTGI